MSRQSFRSSIAGVALAAFGLFGVVQLSACTAPPPPPQVAAEPAPMQAPVIEAAPTPPRSPMPADAVAAGRTKIALLAPLSGPNKQVGQAMLDAANMALFDVSADIALLPRDTGSTPDGARAAASRAVSDGAAMILGPVFASSVPPVREVTQAQQTPVIAYTTDATMAGGNVFVMGFTPAGQIERVVAFAKSRGMTKLAALVPENSYGAAVTTEINAIRGRLGLQPPRIMTIARDAKAQLASLSDDPPEMLLLAVGGDQLVALAPALADYTAAHPVQLLGTGLWADDPALATVPALAGGWYAAPLPGAFGEFAARFRQVYKYRPPRIATLAYDSVALAWSVSRGGSPGAPIRTDLLLQPNGFIGIDGGIRFQSTGLSDRNLAILAVGPDGATVVDPPPPNFERLGE
jgi:ABC-type branched-subunit amino acid transport system substrate-binding protein